MTKKEIKRIDTHDKKLIDAKQRLIEKGYQTEAKKDMEKLLDFVRPEYMTTDIFKSECEKVMEKHLEKIKNEVYDPFEKEVIKNTLSSIYEFMLKAYLTMCYYN